jgi:hypothetical protein
MLTVAIASENDALDAEVYRQLLARLLGTDVQRWKTDITFQGGGFRHVYNLVPTFLEFAAKNGVTRALIAIDNDGGSQRCPEHGPTHVAAQHGAGEEDCRVCWLGQRVPETWKAEPSTHRACIIVPVQTLETWLLCLNGHDFGDRRPEQTYDRPALKKKFYGRPIPPSRRCTELALEQLGRPDALDILRQRPSFQHFEQQLRSW